MSDGVRSGEFPSSVVARTYPLKGMVHKDHADTDNRQRQQGEKLILTRSDGYSASTDERMFLSIESSDTVVDSRISAVNTEAYSQISSGNTAIIMPSPYDNTRSYSSVTSTTARRGSWYDAYVAQDNKVQGCVGEDDQISAVSQEDTPSAQTSAKAFSREYEKRHGEYQVASLQRQINQLKEQTSSYHELLESYEQSKHLNSDYEEELTHISNKFKETHIRNKRYQHQLNNLRDQVKKQQDEQNERDIVFHNKIKQMKAIIIKDQRFFADREVEHEKTLIALEEEKKKTKRLQRQIDELKKELLKYTDGTYAGPPASKKQSCRENKNHDEKIEKEECDAQTKLEKEISELKIELAQVRSREDWHVLQLKQYEEERAEMIKVYDEEKKLLEANSKSDARNLRHGTKRFSQKKVELSDHELNNSSEAGTGKPMSRLSRLRNKMSEPAASSQAFRERLTKRLGGSSRGRGGRRCRSQEKIN